MDNGKPLEVRILKSIVFLVLSVIEFAPKPLSYSRVRSVFTPQERTLQTIQTIQSIRQRVPSARIFLVEMGLVPAPKSIQELVDEYLYVGEEASIREAVDGAFKGYGEALGLLAAYPYLQSLQADYCLKMSGRYYLNDHFDISKWNLSAFTCKQYRPQWMSTRLYGFPLEQSLLWKTSIEKGFPALQRGENLEQVLWRVLRPNLHYIGRLGISGVIAPSNGHVSE